MRRRRSKLGGGSLKSVRKWWMMVVGRGWEWREMEIGEKHGELAAGKGTEDQPERWEP